MSAELGNIVLAWGGDDEDVMPVQHVVIQDCGCANVEVTIEGQRLTVGIGCHALKAIDEARAAAKLGGVQ